MNKISIAIPFFNRSLLIDETLKNLISDERVGEIIISDDCSTDEQFHMLVEKTKEISKIKIIKNTTNVGCFNNKYISILNCSNEWVYLLDSDNYLYENSIDAIYKEITWNPKFCYNPSEPLVNGNRNQFEMRGQGWCTNHGRFGFEPIDMAMAVETFKKDNGFSILLNTGNFFVNKNEYIKIAKYIFENNINPYASDVIAFNYLWLSNGNCLKITNELKYYHRTYSGGEKEFQTSHWNKFGAASMEIANQITNSMLLNTTPDFLIIK